MRQEADLVKFLQARRPGDIATVPPVVAEIEFGIQRVDASSKKRLLLEAERDRLLNVVKVLPWTTRSSVLFGTIKSDLERAGNLIDDFDIAIAAIGISHDARVLTANLVHFHRVAGLTCSHWSDAS